MAGFENENAPSIEFVLVVLILVISLTAFIVFAPVAGVFVQGALDNARLDEVMQDTRLRMPDDQAYLISMEELISQLTPDELVDRVERTPLGVYEYAPKCVVGNIARLYKSERPFETVIQSYISALNDAGWERSPFFEPPESKFGKLSVSIGTWDDPDDESFPLMDGETRYEVIFNFFDGAGAYCGP